MDASVVEALLPTDAGLEEVRKEIATRRRWVPAWRHWESAMRSWALRKQTRSPTLSGRSLHRKARGN